MQTIIGVLNLSERQVRKILRTRSKNKNKHVRFLGEERLAIKAQFVDYLNNMKNPPECDRESIADSLSRSAKATSALLKNKRRILSSLIRDMI